MNPTRHPAPELASTILANGAALDQAQAALLEAELDLIVGGGKIRDDMLNPRFPWNT